MATLTSFIAHCRDVFEQTDAILGFDGFGFRQQTNAGVKDYPCLFILPGTPDATVQPNDILSGVIAPTYNLQFLLQSQFQQEEQSELGLQEKYDELNLTLWRYLADIFKEPHFKDYKLIGQMPIRNNYNTDNGLLAESLIQVTVQLFNEAYY